MQTQQLVTAKQAAAVLGVDKTALEERLESGRLRGKKERILSKDTWFIYKTELDQLLEKQSQRILNEQAEFDFSPLLGGLPACEPPEAEPSLNEQYQLTLKLMAQEFAQCMKTSLEHIHDLREQVKEAEGKLLLLPDLERRAADDRRLIDDKDAALSSAYDRISQLQAEVDRLNRPWWHRLFSHV